ncbi:MAG: endo-1,4-beta-xylanase, partial [Lachnospiraceae bacterium]|nr:endo-1,4-beta-xylanase [Lachnospiraceae bacterium]
KVDFSALNEEARFKLPEAINLENCKSITYKVASQNGPINLYVGSDGTKLKSYWYKDGAEAYTVAPEVTNKINTIGVQCAGETYTEGATVIVTGVTFVMKGSKPLPTPTDGVYTYEYFEEAEVSEGVTVEENAEDGSAVITFPAEGNSLTMEIPDSVDINHLVSIDFSMSMNSAATMTVSVLDKNMNPIVSSTGDSVVTNCHSEAKYIRFTSNSANTVVNLENVKFNIYMNAFEAIVLNGNFDREDLSMWGSALWGSVDGVDTTITAQVSDTPIFKDVYTYGHLSDRSSPYVCFAQDISDRVKKGQWYEINYWVRLDAEDYKDAGTVMREITCSPYCFDENGKEYYGLMPSGHYKQSMDAGVWTNMVCKIYVPLWSTGYVLRIVEQGTSYGSGNCVMGSYDITGVTMVECDAPPVPKNNGGGSTTTNTTVTKEASWIATYNMEDLLVEWASADYEKTASNGLNITFDNNYDEVRMDLPRELDMATAAYVKAKISSQNVPIAVKLYYKGSQVDVGYYNNIQSEYTLVPSYTGKVDAIGIMSLATPNPADAYANFESITFGLTEEPAPLPVRTEIVLNGDFANADLSDWKASFWGDGVTMTQKTSAKEIAPGVTNYAEYSKRTSPYQCFAQDITEMVEEGETYTFSFWGKLSKDYEGAPESQRIIQFAPYTVDSDGNADYNPKLEGNYLQICEPGEWTYFEGKYKVTNPNDVKKVVIRILEQGTNYGQGDCVLGSFAVADVKMAKYVPDPPSIDEDVPNLKDVLPEAFGEDFLIGTAVTLNEIDDIGVELLANKHFNAITIGNELKPDALFNYSNSAHTQLQTITFNGQSLEVPTLSFYRAEEVLDKILKWNESHPESPIKVRGHVLVWHSQTPEWWFREGYVVGQNADGTENYVTPEVMNLRLEWYVKTGLEHFTGEDSKYKDLFYGWDVVNEAVSNGGNGYRTDKVSSMEAASLDTHSNNSSWWAVYQSNEFIINAFKYANMYAPADVELYYNDYNECDNKKMVGIVKLLSDVKEAEGTRIDGMGMQAHYNMFNPSVKAFETAIRAYAEVVGEVHITEWDMKASGSIDNEDKKQAEYLAQGERYRNFYEILKALDAEEGIEIGCITFWGTVDHHSWLQESSTVGGGSDGDLTHCPLLFSDNYKVKPAYWAFVDYSVIDPDYVAPELVGAKTEEDKQEENKEDVKEEKPAEGDTSGETGKTDAPVAEATPEPEKQEASAPATEAPKSEEEGGNNVVPIAVGGGVAGVGVIGAIVAWLKKRKKVSE